METKKDLWQKLQGEGNPGKRNSRMGRVPTVKFRKRRPRARARSRRRARR